MEAIKGRDFGRELIFSTSRSSGPGGQNVNKVNTKVELRFNIVESELLSTDEKALLFEKLKTKITNDGFIILTCQTERSQIRNKGLVVEKFYKIFENALKPTKKRKKAKISRATKERRLNEKKLVSEKKTLRKKIE